jgi:hypothetical protein
MATISNTPRPGYVWDSADNVWYPIGVGAHQHTNAADTPAVMPYSTYAAAGKNKIINGDFRINQRNFTSVSADNSFTFDRFRIGLGGSGTLTATPQTFTAGTAPVAGYESINFVQLVTASASGTNDYKIFIHPIEDVRTLANQNATLSFWAKTSSGTPKIALELTQVFGSGGSGAVDTYGGQVTLSTSWTRYSVTVSVPSISGKTIGTSSSLLLQFWLSGGSDFNSRTGSLGNQNGTFQIWGVQLEAGSTATAFQTATGTIPSELAACQRYYWRINGSESANALISMGMSLSTSLFDGFVNHPVAMRVTPTTLDYSGTRIVIVTGSVSQVLTPTSMTIATGNSGLTRTLIEWTKAGSFTAGDDGWFSLASASDYFGLGAEL